jgi:hypothetical protein
MSWIKTHNFMMTSPFVSKYLEDQKPKDVTGLIENK